MLIYKAEYCFTIEEALIQQGDNMFPREELAEQMARIEIYKDVPIDVNLENIKYNGLSPDYNKILEDLEFYSFLKREEKQNVYITQVKNGNGILSSNLNSNSFILAST